MRERPHRVVQVRVNARGRRVVGCVELPDGCERISDLLNAEDACLYVLPNEEYSRRSLQGCEIILKGAITYLEAIEEPKTPDVVAIPGEFRSIVLALADLPDQQVVAEIFVPATKGVPDVLNDSRRFINLRNVHFSNLVERYGYLAVGKEQIILVKV